MTFAYCSIVVLRCMNKVTRTPFKWFPTVNKTYSTQTACRKLIRGMFLYKDRVAGLYQNIPLRNGCGNYCFFASNSKVEGGLKVDHDQNAKRFFIDVNGLGRAYLEYEREDQLIKLLHTEVPQILAGRGHGKTLAKEALEYVAKNDLQLEIYCDFVRNYVSKYEPKYIKYLK